MAKNINFSGHTVICGWNFQGEGIVSEILRAKKRDNNGIVVLAENDERPVKDERVEFIKGDPSQDADLVRAGIKNAKSAIVLTDYSKGVNEADARALMIVLAIEALNREVHTCVQIMNSANRVHLEHAHADEIICIDELGGNLVVTSALNHGVSKVISELCTFNKGSEFYRYDRPISKQLIGKKFTEALAQLAMKKIILLAIETDYSPELVEQMSSDIVHTLPEVNRAIVINPCSDYQIRENDALFIVAEEEPDML